MLWQALLWRPLFIDRKTRNKILISPKSHTNSVKTKGPIESVHTSDFKHFNLLNLLSVYQQDQNSLKYQISFLIRHTDPMLTVQKRDSAYVKTEQDNHCHTAELTVFLTHLLPHRQDFWLPSQVGKVLKKPVQNDTCHFTQKFHPNRAKDFAG